ncbi:MAG: sulfatase-like hydrolase/transferase [Planctomycetota bacterium]|nr:sulfatase-like hydrolase/transferase [Planctomycetota bacterium]
MFHHTRELNPTEHSCDSTTISLRYRVSLLRTFKDGFYPGLNLLPDGTIIATTYTTYRQDDGGCSIVSVRFKLSEIDTMAAEGVLFRNAFVTTSVCSPSRAAIVTGQFARSRGIGDLSATVTPVSWADTLPAILRKGRYSTRHIGKWEIGPGEEGQLLA